MSNKVKRFNKGFTLIELMMTVAITGVVMTVGVPSFKQFMASGALTSDANLLVGSFNLARSEAIKRNEQVIIRRNGSTDYKWEDGWSIFVNIKELDNNKVFNDNGDTNLCEPDEDCMIKIFSPESGNTIRTVLSDFKDYIGFEASGLREKDAGVVTTFNICSEAGSSTHSRKLLVNKMGRAKGSRGDASC